MITCVCGACFYTEDGFGKHLRVIHREEDVEHYIPYDIREKYVAEETEEEDDD